MLDFDIDYEVRDGNIEILSIAKYTQVKDVWFFAEVGVEGVKEIKYHTPQGHGDLHYCDIMYDDGTGRRLFNVDEVKYKFLKK